MMTRANYECLMCDYCRNCIGGAYCVRMGRYVEYLATPACGINGMNNDNLQNDNDDD